MTGSVECKPRHCSEMANESINNTDYQCSDYETKHQPRWAFRGRKLQIASVLAVNILSISFGTVVGWSTAVGPTINERFSPGIASWVVALTIPVSVVGSLAWGAVSIRFGPRNSCLTAAVPMIAGWIFLLDPLNLWSVLAGRALCGLATGAIIVALPLYVSEITEDALRGRLGSLLLLFINAGILLGYGLGGLLSPVGISVVCVLLPILFFATFIPCPESPLFLFANGRETDGQEALQKLRQPGADLSSELSVIRAAVKGTDSSEARLIDLIRGRAARKACIISLGALTIQQGSGISPVMYYAGQIFENAGGNLDPIVGACIVGGVQLIGSVIATSLMDKAGRRTLMLLSCIIMCISQASLGFALFPDGPAPTWLPVVSLSVYILGYALGAGPAPFVIVSEISAPRFRAMICGVALAYNSTMSFILTKTFPDLSYLIGDFGVFWLFAALCAAGAVFIYFVLPETSGRSSESIQAELEGEKPLKTRSLKLVQTI